MAAAALARGGFWALGLGSWGWDGAASRSWKN